MSKRSFSMLIHCISFISEKETRQMFLKSAGDQKLRIVIKMLNHK